MGGAGQSSDLQPLVERAWSGRGLCNSQLSIPLVGRAQSGRSQTVLSSQPIGGESPEWEELGSPQISSPSGWTCEATVTNAFISKHLRLGSNEYTAEQQVAGVKHGHPSNFSTVSVKIQERHRHNNKNKL